MFKATKEFRFEAAHRLMFHEGACQKVHGHSYKVEVTVGAHGLDSNGLVVDFSEIKKVVSPIIEAWDHSLILYTLDPLLQKILEANDGLGLMPSAFKIVVFESHPTAENMARYIGEFLVNQASFYPQSVRVWETPTCFGEWEALL